MQQHPNGYWKFEKFDGKGWQRLDPRTLKPGPHPDTHVHALGITRDPLTIEWSTRRVYPPPPRDVVSKLVGKTVELISFGQYVLHLSLDSGDTFSIACPFRFDSSDHLQESSIQEFPLQASNIPRVLGAVVQAADAEADGTLRLDFANGDTLIAYANETGYEAYTLSVDGKEHVV